MKALFKANVFYLFVNFLNASTAFLLIPLYLDKFSVEQYGLLALMNAFYSVITIFVTLNLQSSLQTFYFDFEHDRKRLINYLKSIYSLAFLIAIAFVLILTITGPMLFGFLFNSKDAAFYPNGFLVVCNAALTSLNQVYYVFLRNEEKHKKYGLLMLISTFLNIVLQVILIAWFDFNITGVFLSVLVANGVIFLLINVSANLLSFSIVLGELKSAVKYCVWLLPFLLIQWFLAKGDRFVVEQMIGLRQLGVYALLMNVSMIVSLVATSFLTSFRPTLYREFKDTQHIFSKKILSLLFPYLFSIISISFVIYLIVQNIEFFGIAETYLSVKDFIALALTLFVIRVTIRFFNEYLTYNKRSRDLTVFSIISSCIYVLLIYVYSNQLTLTILFKILIAANFLSMLAVMTRCYYLSKSSSYEKSI